MRRKEEGGERIGEREREQQGQREREQNKTGGPAERTSGDSAPQREEKQEKKKREPALRRMAPLRAGARSSITAPRPPRRNARAFGGGAEARARAKQRERRGRKIFRFRRRRTCGGRRRRALPSFGGTRSIRVPCASAAPLPSLLLTPKYGAERRDTRSIGRRDPERPTGRVGRPADSPKHNVFFSLSSLSPSNSIPLSPAFLFFLSLSFRFFFSIPLFSNAPKW